MNAVTCKRRPPMEMSQWRSNSTTPSFLVSEPEFNAIFGRIQERGLAYWADPSRTKPGEINRRDGGRGVYFQDPSGHLLEIITRPYSGDGGSLWVGGPPG